MKTTLLAKSLAIAAAVLLAAEAFGQAKNVAPVEYRTLPADFENLPRTEVEKWNFGFRPYGAEAASVLWSDPNVIRNVTAGADTDEKHLATGLYVTCDAEALTVLVFGALRDSANKLKNGQNVEALSLECFFVPGDADNPQIENYQHFGVTSIYPYYRWQLSWMKEDRNVRSMFEDMKVDPRNVSNGVVLRFSFPWVTFWDKLPVFQTKADNFWRLSVIRWGGSFGGETWGGRVHSQTKCGYIRMPDFTPKQQTKLMETTILKLWARYQAVKNDTAVNPNAVSRTHGYYRGTIDNLPHSWMNVNEDLTFRDTILVPLIKERDAIGEGLANFDQMSLAEQKAFYLKNAPLLANFQYDIDDAYAAYLKSQIMKR